MPLSKLKTFVKTKFASLKSLCLKKSWNSNKPSSLVMRRKKIILEQKVSNPNNELLQKQSYHV
jgi:hypothetical protein